MVLGDARRQTVREPGMALAHAVVGDRDMHGFRRPHQHHQFPPARDAGVQKVALQHHVMLGQDGDNHGGVFRSLGFVDGYGVGRHDLVQLVRGVDDVPLVKAHGNFPVFLVHMDDAADIAVEHVLVVVVPYLHDLVAETVLAFPALQLLPLVVERRLELGVEIGGTGVFLLPTSY